MKRLIRYTFLGFLTLSMSSCVTCKRILFSPVLGIDASKFSEDDNYGGSNGESLVGIQAGLDAITPINDQLSLESGLHISSKGSKTSISGDGVNFEDKINMTYIDVPLLTRYNLGQGGFSVYGGLQPSILLDAKQKTDIDGDGSTDSQKVTNSFKTLDFAGSIGLGYEFGNGIRLNLGYDHGFTNISEGGNEFGAAKLNNRVFKLTVGYTLGKK